MSAFFSLSTWGAIAYDAALCAIALFMVVAFAVMSLSGSISEQEDRYDE